MLFRSGVVAFALLLGLLPGAAALAAPSSADCAFQLGFAALAGQIPERVGACTGDEAHSPYTGDALQETTGGLLAWRKADNWTAFTDGTTTWINGPAGLQSRPNDARFPWEADAGSYAPAGGAAPNPAPAQLLPEDLLATLPGQQEVQGFLPGLEQGWWPSAPWFEMQPYTTAPPQPGERFFLGRVFERHDPAGGDQVQTASTALGLYDSPEHAAAGLAALLADPGEGATRLDGPAFADEAAYLTLPATDDFPPQYTIRFRRGPVVARLSLETRDTAPTPDDLARLAAPLDQRILAVLAGSLLRAPLPADLAANLPVTGPENGPLLGSAQIGIESWALHDTGGREHAMQVLQSLGAGPLGFRLYGLPGATNNVAEAVLFRFDTPQAAEQWVNDAIAANQAGEVRLDPGQTGPLSAFRGPQEDLQSYNLQFARGRYVGNILCYPASGDLSPGCEAATRAFAERWYALLPAE